MFVLYKGNLIPRPEPLTQQDRETLLESLQTGPRMRLCIPEASASLAEPRQWNYRLEKTYSKSILHSRRSLSGIKWLFFLGVQRQLQTPPQGTTRTPYPESHPVTSPPKTLSRTWRSSPSPTTTRTPHTPRPWTRRKVKRTLDPPTLCQSCVFEWLKLHLFHVCVCVCVCRGAGAGGHHGHCNSSLPGSVCPPRPHRHHTQEVHRLLERTHPVSCVSVCVCVCTPWVCMKCSLSPLISNSLLVCLSKTSCVFRFAVGAENCGRSLDWLFTDLLLWTHSYLWLNMYTCY